MTSFQSPQPEDYSAEERDSNPSLSVPWNTQDVWTGSAALGLLLIAALFVSFIIQELTLDLNLGLIISVVELILLIPVWWLALRKYNVGWRALGLREFPTSTLGLGCGLMILSYAFNLVYSLVLSQFGLQIQPDLTPIFAELSSPWPLLVGGAIVAPVVEEIFFRGFVFAGLRDRYGWQKAAVISSSLFGLVHFTPTAILPIFLLGYIFAYLYQRTGSIWPAILMHASSNALALGAAYLLANTNLIQQ